MSLTKKDRACLVLERVLCTVFCMLNSVLNGPLYLCVSPMRWKRAVGMKVGGHKEGSSKAQQHAQNKKRGK